ncbi:BQ2448_8076 [Microbotryum intermedium]|uniref:BQ2448_8076 protein n=1 Tax=Microbotryum intermedium TaxID=269621 RepID=A0A238FMD6_9BASI|nr:BQ2448_8076 [Microbotryum intermedium]
MGSLAERLQATNNVIIAQYRSTSTLVPKTITAYEKSLQSYSIYLSTGADQGQAIEDTTLGLSTLKNVSFLDLLDASEAMRIRPTSNM